MNKKQEKISIPVPKPRNNLWKKRGTIKHKNKKKQPPPLQHFE